MKIAAVIAEYNPFTGGHEYHISRTRELTGADYVIAIMSGNFVQRGEPAIFDKQFRTRLALEGGCDAVLELPALFALQSAETFAYGGVRILDRLNCIDYLSFGSEGDLSILSKIALLLAEEPYSFKKELAKNLDSEQPFAVARTNAITSYLNLYEDEAALLSMPNCILAIEYMKKLYEFESSIVPVAIPRLGAGYHDESEACEFPSATAVRNAIRENRLLSISRSLPARIAKLISQKTTMADNSDFFDLIKYAVLRSDAEKLARISGITEGLENLFVSNAYAQSFDEMLEAIHSKRYTRSAVSRMMYNVLLGITKSDVEKAKRSDSSLYARVLGFRQESSSVIKYISENSSIPVITNVPAYKKMLADTSLFEKDLLASDIYKLATGAPKCDLRPDFKLVPIIRGNDFPEL